uniref:Putative ovule protein n=1 Tax=Solanum chacoense TaxID=4108 RepID=A0A0V0H993_SOLCH
MNVEIIHPPLKISIDLLNKNNIASIVDLPCITLYWFYIIYVISLMFILYITSVTSTYVGGT